MHSIGTIVVNRQIHLSDRAAIILTRCGTLLRIAFCKYIKGISVFSFFLYEKSIDLPIS